MELLARYDEQLRRRFPGTATQRMEYLPEVTRALMDATGLEFGAVLFSRLVAKSVDAILDREIRYFGGLGRAFEWKLYGHDGPPDMAERLVARGFRQCDRETLMARDLSVGVSASLPTGITLHQLESPVDFDELTRVSETPNPVLIGELRNEKRAAPERLQVWVARDGVKTVGHGWLRFYPGSDFADLWGGHTHPDYRGRGIYRALVAARAAQARANGVRFLTTDAASSSQPILETMGFTSLTSTTPFLWVPL